MLEYIKRDKPESCDALEDEFPGCMFIVVDINDDLENLVGKLYCVSHSSSSYKELRSASKELYLQGRHIAVLGLYKDAWAPGLQVVVENSSEV